MCLLPKERHLDNRRKCDFILNVTTVVWQPEGNGIRTGTQELKTYKLTHNPDMIEIMLVCIPEIKSIILMVTLCNLSSISARKADYN